MKILVATGGSPHSEIALRFCTYLMQLINHKNAQLTVLTVVTQQAGHSAQAEAILADACQLLGPQPPNVQTKIRVGHPAEEIIREGEEEGCSLLVVGERQHHGLVTRFILGSTAQRVVEHAPCPVVIAKGKIGPIRRILLCDSGVETPSLVKRFITQLAGLLTDNVEITVLHVMSQISAGPGVSGRQLRSAATELIETGSPEGEILRRDLHLLAQLNISPQPKVRHGLVVDEILDETRSEDYDLVVIGAHRGEGWRRILLDDLAHRVITQMDRPIAIVR